MSSTSSGAAFALQVSIAVWSDAAGICKEEECLFCVKLFHTELLQRRTSLKKTTLTKKGAYSETHVLTVYVFKQLSVVVVPVFSQSHLDIFLETASWIITMN